MSNKIVQKYHSIASPDETTVKTYLPFQVTVASRAQIMDTIFM